MLKRSRVRPRLHPVAQTAPQARDPDRCSQSLAIERRSLGPEKSPSWPAIAQPVRRLLSLRRWLQMCDRHYRADASAAHHPFAESRAADPDLLRSAPANMGSRCRNVSIAVLLVKADCEFTLAQVPPRGRRLCILRPPLRCGRRGPIKGVSGVTLPLIFRKCLAFGSTRGTRSDKLDRGRALSDGFAITGASG